MKTMIIRKEDKKMMTPINLYTGVPQEVELQVFKAKPEDKVVITQVILNNSETQDATVKLIINTQDVATFKLAGGETQITNLYLVLNPNDYVALKQDGKVSVSLNGSIA